MGQFNGASGHARAAAAFALRAQYERISYGAGDPNLLSLGLTWML